MQNTEAQRLARIEKVVTELVKSRNTELEIQKKKLEALTAKKKADSKAALEKNPIERMHDHLARTLPENLRPRNLGSYADAVWSYWFPMISGVIAPGTAVDIQVTVTQEAGFIMTHMFPTVFKYLPDTPGAGQNQYNLIKDFQTAEPTPLKITLIDAQSSRKFMENPLPVSLLGNNELPRKLPSPNFYLPNSTIVARVQNDSSTAYYKLFLNLLGARVRISDATALGTMKG